MALDRTAGIVRMAARAIPMSRLITPMHGRDGRMVIDRTGMTGVYALRRTSKGRRDCPTPGWSGLETISTNISSGDA